nr:MAG TPA: endosialidase chaperone [Caudoviricetes sp.]
MMNVTDYTNIKTLLIKFKEKSDVLYAKAAALSNYATIEWVGTQIPSVGNGTVTIKQNGTSKGSFSMNQSGGATINLTDTTYSSLSAVSGGTDKSLVTTGEKYTWNNKWDYNATTIAGVKVNNAVAADKAPWSGITGKPTTLKGYGITDASRIFRYTIPASGNKGVRITFTSGEPVKITVSGANQGAQLVLIGTGYGEGGFVRNNFTEVVQGTYYTWCLADETRSVEIFSIRPEPDMVTVESPSPVTFTAISALSQPAVNRHLLTSENYSYYALPLTGGTITGSIKMEGISEETPLIYNYGRSVGTASGWARNIIEGRVDNKNGFHVSVFGSYTPKAENNKIQYAYLGFAEYNGLNLRISDTSLTWGNDAIYHAGNFIDGVNYISPKTTLKGYGIEDWVLKNTANSPDTFQTAGIYRVSDVGTTGNGYEFRYGHVLVLRGGTGSDTIAQIAAPYFGSNLYFRSGTISNFTDAAHPWRTIFNSGNCNLPTVPWTCSSLTATNDVTAKAGLYGQYLEFTSIGSSAGHGGFIDFHFNGNTADYTSRIIEDASGQITIKAGVLNIGTSAKGFLYMLRPSVNYIWANKAGGEICIGTADGGETSELNSGINIIGKRVYIGGTVTGSDALNVAGDVKATGWCKATNGLLIEESEVYYTHHSQFGEIDIVKGNEFIWGSKADTLYFNYRASANGTTTVAHYIWNAGSPTTYATHTMGTLTVLGAITATTTIYAKTGIYTDGYISAKQASTSSDRRLKTDFRSIDNALKYVLNTHYTRFRWKDDNKESIGIIAQEEQNREYGFLVQNNEKIGHLTYDYAASTALLGAAIQEEDSKVEKLKKRVAELEKELSNLKRKWQH